MENQIKIFCADWSFDSTQDKPDYEILDTGEGEKLERVGKYIFVRPYEDAVWKKTLPKNEWEKADGKFWSSKEGAKGGWKISKDGPLGNSLKDRPLKWEMSYGNIKFLVSPTPFRHFGFFPEQASHWEFIEKQIASLNKIFSSCALPGVPGGTLGDKKFHSAKPRFLNLFGYTGVASLFALRAGAEVTHVDASKTSIAWAKENQKLSGLENLPMRVIEDDVLKFLEREEKRGNKYDAVIMDPPKFGRGPKGETWKFENDLPKLLEKVRKVLSDKPLFVILTSYNTDSSALSLGYSLKETMKDFQGEIQQGELCLKEKSNNRFVSLANTAVWSSR